MKWLIVMPLLFLTLASLSQVDEIQPDGQDEQQLEGLSEMEEAEPEDDYMLQQLSAYRTNPLNINEAGMPAFSDFPLMNALQVNNLMTYRALLGKLISVYELQAVPGFDLESIKRMIPYITTESAGGLIRTIGARLHGGQKTALVRAAYIPEISKGFQREDSSSGAYFQGSRSRLMVRYKYQYKNLLQFGWLGDKDAGEPFFKGKQKQGFDFYSFHFFIRNWLMIKSLAIGDYTINLGQGLIHWQSQAFKKSSGVINIKRQSEALRPYHSPGEYNFHRGIALTLGKRNWEITMFGSRRNISANISADTGIAWDEVASSFQTSGLHRTETELNDRNSLGMAAGGGRIKLQKTHWHLAVNGAYCHYSLPVQKRDEPYNLYAVNGKEWMNYSVDYSFTLLNFHAFGEVAADQSGHTALVSGLMASLDREVDIAILYRTIGKAYQSIYGNAFTENSLPTNERGFYFGISLKPLPHWRIDMYADLFSFPWLKYRVNAPSVGREYLLQLNWKPDKKTEAYSRLKYTSRQLNQDPNGVAAAYPDDQPGLNWRAHIQFQASRRLILKHRIELAWIKKPGLAQAETGFLMYCDISWKPPGRPFSCSTRIQYFDTGGYDTRLYAYENDVLYSSSIPANFGKGARYYFNIKSSFRHNFLKGAVIQPGMRVATTLFDDVKATGSGLNEIKGNQKSEIKVQLIINWQ